MRALAAAIRKIDQVAGFMQGTRHEMGRGMMRDALVQSFENIRTRLGGG